MAMNDLNVLTYAEMDSLVLEGNIPVDIGGICFECVHYIMVMMIGTKQIRDTSMK